MMGHPLLALEQKQLIQNGKTAGKSYSVNDKYI